MRELVAAWLAKTAALGPWAPAGFLAAYLVAPVLLIPCLPLTLGGGALFGFWRGCALVSLGSTLGAMAAFSIARRLGRRRLEGLLVRYPRLRAVDASLATGGWRVVLLLRLSPIVPYVGLNYAAGLTPVPAREFLAATWVGMLPATAFYVYLGSAAKTWATKGTPADNPWRWALWGAGLLATAAAMTLLARRARAALEGS
jgi:uncharacterized membrane protein YdjX (TVP38/TMEM64 family)